MPKSFIGLGGNGKFALKYRLKDEFVDDNSWYYTIDAPTRKIRFDWLFTKAKAPKKFNCTEYQPPTPIQKIGLGKRLLSRNVRYRLEATFPTFRTKYEFTWK